MASKMMNATIVTGLLTAALAAGCGGEQRPPPRELQQARFAYERAATGPAARLHAEELTQAWKALAEAEDAYQDAPDADRTRDLAYVAERRAEIASVRAMADQQMQAKQDAERQLSVRQAELAARSAQRVADTGRAMERAGQQITSAAQRQRQPQAGQPMGPGAAASGGMAQVEGMTFRDTPQGRTIVLSGQAMFPSGGTQVRASAQQALRPFAENMRQGTGTIHVRGYTDSSGSDEVNRRVSARRAEAVRDFLVAQGIPRERIRTEGLGAADFVGDNTTAEGRAQNRRVEITLESGMP